MIDGETVGCAIARPSGRITPEKVWFGKTADFPTFIDALQHYLRDNGLQARDHPFALAVAGVPRGDVISLTNCRWFVSVSGLRAFLRSEPVILNACAATAWSLTAIERNQMISIGSHLARQIAPGSTFLCIGAGIGLGVATLHINTSGQVIVLDSEGGHSSFAPQNAMEEELLAFLRAQFSHVSYERILSKPGLQNVYRFLALREGRQSPAPEASDIIAGARQRIDPIAVQATTLFSSILGTFIGCTALTVAAWDGVFLTGDMLRELSPMLMHGDFRRSLAARGRLGKMLESLPVSYVNVAETRLMGAAAALVAKSGTAEAATAPLTAVA
jgi:glucokinase